MSTLRSETARRNGAKSRGPVTTEGRAKSSRNALRHGLSAQELVLPHESAEEFNALVDAYMQQFKPAGPIEADLVQILAATRWRLRRVPGLETGIILLETLRRTKNAENFDIDKDKVPMAWMFQKLADEGKALALITRYESTLNRTYDRAFRQLHVLQASRRRQQNEPKHSDPLPAPDPAVRTAEIPPDLPTPDDFLRYDPSDHAFLAQRNDSFNGHQAVTNVKLDENRKAR